MRIYVAGHSGMVGSSTVRAIEQHEDYEWIGAKRSELNLLNRDDVFRFIRNNSPDAMVVAAAKVGGIAANLANPVSFLSENLQIQTNLLDAAHESEIEKVIFLGSSCIYPKMANQPITETALMTGELESTNQAYALAKISGQALVSAYNREMGKGWLSLMPTNLYGPGDNYHPEESHVIPGLIRKFVLAKSREEKSVTLWGSGKPLREFLHVDDLARAIIITLSKGSQFELMNVGSGEEVSIFDLATQISDIVGFQGEILWDESRPDGTPRKLLDSTLIRSLGWTHQIPLLQGLEMTISGLPSSIFSD